MLTMLKCLITFMLLPGSLIGQVVISGRVVDQEDRPLGSTAVRIEPADKNLKILAQEIKTNLNGEFNMNFDLPTDIYYLTVVARGFQPIIKEPRQLKNATVNRINIKLAPIPHFEVTVSPPLNEIALDHIELSQNLEDRQIDSTVIPHSDKLQSIVGALPGVTPDASGKFHQEGAPTDQTNWLLDGFRANDPVSGQLETKLSVESLKSLEMTAGRYSVDLGRGETTTKMISGTGDKNFKSQITNFVPGVETTNGIQLAGWNPRFALSGPVKSENIRFFDSTELNYNRNFIHDLKEGPGYVSAWETSNLLRLEVNLGTRNVLSGGILTNYFNSPKTGLSFLNPISTTLDKRARRYFYSAQDMLVVSPTTLIVVGYARYDTFSREAPQGHEIFKLSPFGNSGNSSSNIKRWGRRHEFMTNINWKISDLLPNHQFKAGANFNRSNNEQDSLRNGFEHFNSSGLPTLLAVFGGSGKFGLSNLESSLYFQDRINIRFRGWPFYMEAGIRYDRDSILPRGTTTPRLSATFAPPKLKQTKVSIGYGLMPTMTNLGLFGRKLDQYSLSTYFDNNGLPLGHQQLTVFASDERKLKIPRISNFSLGLEQRIGHGLILKADYLRKRSGDGFTFTPSTDQNLIPDSQKNELPQNKIAIIYYLNNLKIQIYDSLKLGLNKKFEKPIYQSKHWDLRQQELSLIYIRSRTFSNSNISPYIDDPLTSLNGAGRTPWDIPNRVTMAGSTKISDKTAVYYFADWRDGTPFSVFDDRGRQIGDFNSWRLPRHVIVDLHIERKFSLFGRDWALRVGFDNLTNHTNYSQANPELLASGKPQFFGVEPRKLVIRIRWLK